MYKYDTFVNCKAYDIQIMRTEVNVLYCLNGLCQTVNRSETSRVCALQRGFECFKKENPTSWWLCLFLLVLRKACIYTASLSYFLFSSVHNHTI